MQRAAFLLAHKLSKQQPVQQARFLAAAAGGSQQHAESKSPHTALLAASAALLSAAAGGLYFSLVQPGAHTALCEQQEQASSGQTVVSTEPCSPSLVLQRKCM